MVESDRRIGAGLAPALRWRRGALTGCCPVTHTMFTLRSPLVRPFPSLPAYGAEVAEHEASARRIGPEAWDVVCPGCPGHDAQVASSRHCPALTSREQAQLLAEFHSQIHRELGDWILRC